MGILNGAARAHGRRNGEMRRRLAQLGEANRSSTLEASKSRLIISILGTVAGNI